MIGRLLRASRAALLSVLGTTTRRHVVLLDRIAADDAGTLDIRAPYRVDGPVLEASVRAPEAGRLEARILGYVGSFPTKLLGTAPATACGALARVTVDLDAGTLSLDGTPWGTFAGLTGRRFCLHFRWTGTSASAARTTGHYRPGVAGPADATYYQGGTYTDHEATESHEAQEALALIQRYGGQGPVLEVGCATGGTLQALRDAGLPAVGIDISSWAVEQARERLDERSAFVCDVESDDMPTPVIEQGPFGVLLLWAVLEHFRDPFETLTRLRSLAAPDALLVVNTTNASSLTHFLFAEDWEGHFDPTHHGVERVSVTSIREGLPALGWDILHLETHTIWTGSADPLHAALRDADANDARFRRLLRERDAGDFLILVAKRGDST